MLIGLIGTDGPTKFVAAHFCHKFHFRHFQFLNHVRQLCEIIYHTPFDGDGTLILPNMTCNKDEVIAHVDHLLRSIQPWVFQQNLQLKYENEDVIVSDVCYEADSIRIKELGGVIVRLCQKNVRTHIAPDLCSDFVIEFDRNLIPKCEQFFEVLRKKQRSI